MNEFKTYTIKSKDVHAVWVFKYHLSGELFSFEVLDGSFSSKQADWLFRSGRFPYNETIMKVWLKQYRKFFEFEVGIPEITFEYFYEIYGRKRTKAEALKFWSRMTPKDRTLAVLGVKRYLNICKLDNRSPVDPVRYLRNRRFEDEY